MTTAFTPEEHVAIASWLGVPPAERVDPNLTLEAALERLGFTHDPGFYRPEAAAVAAIVLDLIQDRLPNWSVAHMKADGEPEVEYARQPKPGRRSDRLVELLHLFTINWADSGPGVSWPMAYHLTWIPQYERYLVTSSADSDDALGYCDFALGSFPRTDRVVEEAAQIIVADWIRQGEESEPLPWAHFLEAGLIGEEQAKAMAGRAWPPEEVDEDEED